MDDLDPDSKGSSQGNLWGEKSMTHVSPVQIYQFIRRTLFWVGIVAFPMMTWSSSEIDTLEDGVSKRFNGPKVIVPHS